MSDQQDWVFPFEKHVHAVAPGVHEAQNAWLAKIDSLTAPDRKTQNMPLSTRRSFTRGTPRGLFGRNGLMAAHS